MVLTMLDRMDNGIVLLLQECPGTYFFRVTENHCQSHPNSLKSWGDPRVNGFSVDAAAAAEGSNSSSSCALKTRQSRKSDLSATAKSYLRLSCVLLSDQSRWSLAIHKAAWPSFLRLCLKTLLGNAAFFMRAAVL
jgi:hypothetical protein